MLSRFKQIISAISRFGLFASLKSSMEWEEKRYSGTWHRTDLSKINTYIRKDYIKNCYYIAAHAKCSDLERTGFSDEDMPRIYHSEGFETVDGAFGFLTEQVDQANRTFADSQFLFFPEDEMPLRNSARVFQCAVSKKMWEPFEVFHFQCNKCGARLSGDHLLGFTRESVTRCDRCTGHYLPINAAQSPTPK